MKDRDSVFLQANAHYARLVGFKCEQDCIGRTDFDLPCGAVHFASLFQVQDREVMVSATPMRFFDIHPFSNGEWQAFIIWKSFFYEEDGTLGGTFFQGENVTSSVALHCSVQLNRASSSLNENKLLGQFSYILGSMPQKPLLTERQERILFFLIRRYTIKKIALTLTSSLRTVYGEIEKLRAVFGAVNTNDLIDKAISAGCNVIIPTGLSWGQMSIVLQED
jgi:DNA-binding CsgD family transcriptional regulator